MYVSGAILYACSYLDFATAKVLASYLLDYMTFFQEVILRLLKLKGLPCTCALSPSLFLSTCEDACMHVQCNDTDDDRDRARVLPQGLR